MKLLSLCLLVSGDIHPCPGPNFKYPCGSCQKPVKSNQHGIFCELCELWHHRKCVNMDLKTYLDLSTSISDWYCELCNQKHLPEFTDSFFESSKCSTHDDTDDDWFMRFSDSYLMDNDASSETNSDKSTPNSEHGDNFLERCEQLRIRHPKNCIFAYININSLRYKFPELKPVIFKLQPAVFSIAETKLDESFNTGQFILEGYHPPFRRDRTAYGGGLMVYVRSDIPCRRLDYHTPFVESISLEVIINKTPWNVISAYKSPNKVSDQQFISDMEFLYDRSTSQYDRTILLGDLNYDLLDYKKSKPLVDLMDLYSLDNLVKEPTFTSRNGSSLIDIAITTNTNLFTGCEVIDIGSSDGHSMVAAVAKAYAIKFPPKTVTYRSYKTFNTQAYRKDMSMVPFSLCQVFDDPSDSLWAQSLLIREVLDQHAPLKQKKVRPTQPAYMNAKLRKNIFRKTQLHNKYKRSRTPTNWENYRLQRNKTTQIRRSSIKQYFLERCSDGPKNEHFYKTIKPFLSVRYKSTSNLMIQDGGKLLTEPVEVANSMNNFYTAIAANIGEDKALPLASNYTEIPDYVTAATSYHSNHPSVCNIKNQPKTVSDFSFTPVSEEIVSKTLKNLNVKKATGVDNIPAKALVAANDILAAPFTRLYNLCLATSKYPEGAKAAEIVPIYKKDNALLQKNHRPVSILTSSSKVLEKLLEQDLTNNCLHYIYNDYLAAFRRNYSCQHVLLELCDNWRMLKEQGAIPGILLADLSKAFDCLPHSLIITKLQAYGFSKPASTLLADYLSNRPQRVKTGGVTSDWNTILKGVPQGSIMGPIIFNLFMNDIFCTGFNGSLFNYADDNTVLVHGSSHEETSDKLALAAQDIINWCKINQMEANPAKFQAMISNETETREIRITDSTVINTEPSVKLLGVYLDNKLNFGTHVSEIIRKSSRQLNCLKRIAYSFTLDIKLMLYKAFVASNFNYCPGVWHACGRLNTLKIEKIQHRALKFIFSDYNSDYETLLKRANLPTLEVSRLRTLALEVFKIYCNLAPSFLRKGFELKQHSYNLRSGPNFHREHCKTVRYGLHSFRNSGATIWNSLPAGTKSSSDLKTFKNLIQKWSGPTCHCNFCSQY